MAEHITLDRENLLRLVELLRASAEETRSEVPEEIRRAYTLGQQVVFDTLTRIANTSPALYGTGGCPDISALLDQLAAAEAKVARVEALAERWESRTASPLKAMLQPPLTVHGAARDLRAALSDHQPAGVPAGHGSAVRPGAPRDTTSES